MDNYNTRRKFHFLFFIQGKIWYNLFIILSNRLHHSYNLNYCNQGRKYNLLFKKLGRNNCNIFLNRIHSHLHHISTQWYHIINHINHHQSCSHRRSSNNLRKCYYRNYIGGYCKFSRILRSLRDLKCNLLNNRRNLLHRTRKYLYYSFNYRFRRLNCQKGSLHLNSPGSNQKVESFLAKFRRLIRSPCNKELSCNLRHKSRRLIVS